MGAVAVISLFAAGLALAAKTVGPTTMKMVGEGELKWSEGPASLPPGAKLAVLSGDPQKEGPFVMRARLPANYKVPPHFHPAHEHVTVLSGGFFMGMGEKFAPESARELKAGDFAMMPPEHRHFAFTRQQTVIQLHGWGPWAITYVNPADDPRNKGVGGAGKDSRGQ